MLFALIYLMGILQVHTAHRFCVYIGVNWWWCFWWNRRFYTMKKQNLNTETNKIRFFSVRVTKWTWTWMNCAWIQHRHFDVLTCYVVCTHSARTSKRKCTYRFSFICCLLCYDPMVNLWAQFTSVTSNSFPRVHTHTHTHTDGIPYCTHLVRFP